MVWRKVHLGLDGIEGLEVRVEGLKLRVAQGGDGEGLQVQQLGGRRVLLGEDQVAEADWQHRLTGKPLV